ncbi:M20/M25/M40 family metallo-hydrolase [Mesorhizobium sp. M0698]|uniref:M20/M25/M40 family metallo-hydrolase n=1 Tax=Mesorhizobium sp. M0698 TaxID=2956987 RepID=UPI003337D10E
MPDSSIAAIFFDLGDTLGTAVVGGWPPRLTGFDVFPYAPGVLSDLKARGLKLGVISNTGPEKGPAINAVVEPTGLLAHINPELIVYSGDERPLKDGTSVTKNNPEIFRRAAHRARLKASPARNLFIGEDASERQVAVSAGWRVCPHPLLIGEVLAGQSLRFVRINIQLAHAAAPWREELHKRAFLPMQMFGRGGTVVYGLTSQRVALELVNMRFGVEFLGEPNLPLTTDLYLLRDDVAERSGFLAPAGEAARVFGVAGMEGLMVSATPEGVIAAFPPDAIVELDTFHFDGARHGHNLKLAPDPLLWVTTPSTAPPSGFAPEAPAVIPIAAASLATITPDEILGIVKRYCGAAALDGAAGASVTSRHIRHSDNARAIAQLAVDLETAGQGRLQVKLHRFTHVGLELFNVEAELAGESPELVFVTAHLDSTAAFHEPYSPSSDPAPGADDDASGMAAVLAIAGRFAALASTGQPARTVRFVFFNAEEQGLIGSQAYARRSKSRGEAIAAVWQMDMIGYNKQSPRSWEAHAGFEFSPPVEALSRRLADLIQLVATQVSPALPAAQIYHSGTMPAGDPAAGRSDHAAFHAQGYPAIVVSEDFFVGPGTDAPAPEENPNYHRPGDTAIDAEFAADIARAVGAAAWVSAWQAPGASSPNQAFLTTKERTMPVTRELDTRKRSASKTISTPPGELAAGGSPLQSRTNALTGSPAVVSGPGSTPMDKSLIERALTFARSQSTNLGFVAGSPAEFAPDPVIQRTSSGAAAVHLKQQYRGLTVFQMSRAVRFSPSGQVVDATGDTAAIPDGVDVEPKLAIEDAVLAMAMHLASTGSGGKVRDAYGQEAQLPTIDLKDFKPEVIAGFPLPSRAAVLDKGPFENPIPAYLLIFNQPGLARLAWHAVFTFPGYADQYAVIVAADNTKGEILYCKGTMRQASARGSVFEFSPGVADRRLIEFPRPLADYPIMPSSPITGFPTDWVDVNETVGNTTRATLNFTTNTLTGSSQNGVILFEPASPNGDEQKLLNIFYFCSYMHDFLVILGFDEASGNFQQVNFTHTGSDKDPVRARAHSGAVNGTANMSTGPDGLPPLMNMGLVVSTGNHTALDADVVFHEYVHGLTNRLVGGRLNGHSLDKLQSGGMGEGWSDYYALTVQNYFRTNEKTVTGDWVVNNPAGIRRAPYDDAYQFNYGDLSSFPEVHDIGEVWCATLMMMTRKLRTALGNDQQGYRLAWRMVTDGLKLTPANPTFLDARDAILRALDDLGTANHIPPATHNLARKAAWQAFAHFGMGVNATSEDADDVDNVVADFTLAPEV